jgi:hypothetical protein
MFVREGAKVVVADMLGTALRSSWWDCCSGCPYEGT